MNDLVAIGWVFAAAGVAAGVSWRLLLDGGFNSRRAAFDRRAWCIRYMVRVYESTVSADFVPEQLAAAIGFCRWEWCTVATIRSCNNLQ